MIIEFDGKVSRREGERQRLRSEDETACCLQLLERRLVDCYTTVVIPFDESVIFVHLPNCAKFSSRHSKIAQAFDAISRAQLSASAGRVDKRWLLGAV
ncbi:MAG: hypothetical protein WCB53_14425 [Terriglobales bacterium]